jgi:ligand-binding sensor domain-containing protein
MLRKGPWFAPVAGAILYFLLASIAVAQYRFDSWTTDSGLPEDSVNSIIQTHDGYLWLATFGGLVRYDGMSFKVFTPGNTGGLATSRFLALFEVRDLNLWITTENQGLTRYKDEVFATYTKEDGLPANAVYKVQDDNGGGVLIDTPAGSVRWQDGKFTDFKTDPPEPVPSERTYRSRSGAVWYNDSSRLRKLENGRVAVDVPTDIHIRGYWEDSQGRLWVWSTEDILRSFKDGRFTGYAVLQGGQTLAINQARRTLSIDQGGADAPGSCLKPLHRRSLSIVAPVGC